MQQPLSVPFVAFINEALHIALHCLLQARPLQCAEQPGLSNGRHAGCKADSAPAPLLPHGLAQGCCHCRHIPICHCLQGAHNAAHLGWCHAVHHCCLSQTAQSLLIQHSRHLPRPRCKFQCCLHQASAAQGNGDRPLIIIPVPPNAPHPLHAAPHSCQRRPPCRPRLCAPGLQGKEGVSHGLQVPQGGSENSLCTRPLPPIPHPLQRPAQGPHAPLCCNQGPQSGLLHQPPQRLCSALQCAIPPLPPLIVHMLLIRCCSGLLLQHAQQRAQPPSSHKGCRCGGLLQHSWQQRSASIKAGHWPVAVPLQQLRAAGAQRARLHPRQRKGMH